VNLKKLNHEQLIELIESLLLKINTLEEENKNLRAQLALNSSNSRKPPSTDGFKKKLKNSSLREKSGKNSGGQRNHKGHTLNKVDSPDFTIDITSDTCPHCSTNLENIEAVDFNTRQVFDIPLPKIQVTEYKTHNKICPHCNIKHKPKFPNNVTQPVSYGTNIQAFITYLSVQNHIPYNRIKDFFNDFFQCNISEGTVFNVLNRAYDKLETTETEIKNKLLKSPQIHADETGYYVEKLRCWLFSYSNENYTFYDFHKKRGKEAMDDIDFLPNYEGLVTHDCWKAYYKYEQCLHSLCNAHFLRELNGIKENTDFVFPEKLKATLLEMKNLIDSGIFLHEETRQNLLTRYQYELDEGFKEELKANPLIIPKVKKRGRVKQSKAKNLLQRLSKIPEVLGFFINPELIPFDNNLAERDIRMVKVKQKISGLHRSTKGAKQFCRIRGYISSILKNGLNLWDCLQSIFESTPILP